MSFAIALTYYHCSYLLPVRLSFVFGAGNRGNRQKDKCVFLMFLDVNSLTNSKGHMISDNAEAVVQSGGGISMEFSVKELYAIEQIHSEKNLFQLITGFACHLTPSL